MFPEKRRLHPRSVFPTLAPRSTSGSAQPGLATQRAQRPRPPRKAPPSWSPTLAPPRPPIGGPVCQSTSGLPGRELRLRSPAGASIARQPPGRETGRRPAAAASDRPTGRGSAPISSTRPPWRRGGAPRRSGSGNDLAPPPQVGPGPGGAGAAGAREAVSPLAVGAALGWKVRGPPFQGWEVLGALPGAGRRTGCRVWGAVGGGGRPSVRNCALGPRQRATLRGRAGGFLERESGSCGLGCVAAA